MWEKRAFLAYFVGLCAAQRQAMADFKARQAPPSLGKRDQLVNTPVPAFDLLGPREPQNTPAVSNGGSEVFTTVLYPLVPTAAPTANIVPIFITYTGTLAPSAVPEGFQWTAPASEPGTSAATASQNVPTVVNRPSTNTISPNILPIPSSMTTPTSLLPSISTPISSPTMSTPTSVMTSDSFSMTTSTRSSTTSTISSTPPFSTTPSSSTVSVSTTASNTLPAVPTGSDLSKTMDTKETHKFTSGSIAGVIVGVVGGTILFIALALFLWSRNVRSKRPTSPGVYPEEAYLYDPPMTPPREPSPGANGGVVGRALSPEEPGAERKGLMADAVLAGGGLGLGLGGGGAAAAAAARGHDGSEARPPQQWNGYSPVLSQEMGEWSFTAPAAGPSITQAGPSTGNPFTDPSYELAAGARASDLHWPLNPNANSGLGTPPGSPSVGPSIGRPSTSRSQGTASGAPPIVARPSISGVGSHKYYRRVNTPASPPSNPTKEIIPSPHMRELRKAWGMDQ